VMGWGAKKAAALQPAESRIEPVLEPEDDIEIVADKPDPRLLPELEWMRFQANKGWLPERRERVLREFIKSKGLYPELIKFAAKGGR
jgi:hypothetical protein